MVLDSKITIFFKKLNLILFICLLVAFMTGVFWGSDGFDPDNPHGYSSPSENDIKFSYILIYWICPFLLIGLLISYRLQKKASKLDRKNYEARRQEKLKLIEAEKPGNMPYCPDCGSQVAKRVGSPYQWCDNCKKHS